MLYCYITFGFITLEMSTTSNIEKSEINKMLELIELWRIDFVKEDFIMLISLM